MAWSRLVLTACALLTALQGWSQSAPLTYLVSFTDKASSPYSISNPGAYLSARAIARRLDHGIPVDQTDLPVNPAYVQGLNAINGVKVVAKSKWFNNATIMVTDTALLAQVRILPYVQRVKSTSGPHPLHKPKYEIQALRGNTYFTPDTIAYGYAATQIKMLNGQFLHNMGYTGEGIYVAVIDNGFSRIDVLPQYNHLRAAGKLIAGPDFAKRDGSVFNGSAFHGTLVLSCMGAYDPGKFIGTAPDATYLLCISENDTSEFLVEEDLWIAAAEWADSAGADVFNTSLGYTEFDDPSMNHTYADMDGNTARITRGVDMAAKKGILSVNSAGNSGAAAWQYISAPADADSCLTVGAVGPDRLYAGFSSRGPSFDGRIKPNVATQGFLDYLIFPPGDILQGNGTSFSSPVMAGMAACLWQAFPQKSNMEIIRAIEMSASQYTAPDGFLGYGIPDMAKAFYILNNSYTQDGLHIMMNNPFIYDLHMVLYSQTDQDLEINLYDLNGKKITTQPIHIAKGLPAQYTLDVRDKLLRAGVYVVKIGNERGTVTMKVVKQ